jgi:hypothetical protein
MVVPCSAREWWRQASPSEQPRPKVAHGSEVVIALARYSAAGEWHNGLSSKRMFQGILIPRIRDDDQATADKNALNASLSAICRPRRAACFAASSTSLSSIPSLSMTGS